MIMLLSCDLQARGSGRARSAWHRRGVALAGSIVLLGIAATGAAAPQSESVHFSLALTQDALKIEPLVLPDQQALTRVTLTDPGVAYDETPGFPRIPYVMRLIALPPRAQGIQVLVTPQASTVTENLPAMEWAQPGRPGAPNDPDPPLFWPQSDSIPPDASVADLPRWPLADAMLSHVEDAAGYRVVWVRLNPVVWEPQAGRLTYSTATDVEIRYVGGGKPKRPRGYAGAVALERLRGLVANPDVITLVPEAFRSRDYPYIIITDDREWMGIIPGDPLPGSMIAEFQRLADWKTSRGLRARVVTISDIVRGRWGAFGTGARDLQEIIRRFIRWANKNWNTAWVLLGGDDEVLPARQVLGSAANAAHYFGRSGDAKPPEGKVHWDDATSTLRVRQSGQIVSFTWLVSYKTGRVFTRVTAPSAANPGWAYVTDDSYAVESATKTNFVVVRAPTSDLAGTDLVANLDENSIPADLYYSAFGPPPPSGLHDWDTNNNRLYGQYNDISLDGVNFFATVSVGRASTKTGDQAKAFVDKVIAYEKYAGMPAGFARKILLGSTNWGGAEAVVANTDATFDEGEYQHVVGSPQALLRFKSAPGVPGSGWRLLAVTGGTPIAIPYGTSGSGSSPAFYWCFDADCTIGPAITVVTSGLSFSVVPLPTKTVHVDGSASLLDPDYFAYDRIGVDSSVTEKEAMRAKLATLLPELDQRLRLYQDLFDTPDYPSPDLSANNEADMRAALDTGYNVVTLSGHGNWWGCCGASTSYAGILANGTAGGVVYADSCLTARFDQDRAIAEVMTTTASGGAVAYVGNSRYSWVGSGTNFEARFWDGIYWTRHVGWLNETRATLLDDPHYKWANYALNLLGDPEMPLWRKEPKVITPIVPQTVVARKPLVVAVPNTQQPLVVALTGPKGIFQRRTTDGLGQAVFRPAGKPGDQLKVVVSGDDVLPVEVAVGVVAPPR